LKVYFTYSKQIPDESVFQTLTRSLSLMVEIDPGSHKGTTFHEELLASMTMRISS